MYILGSIRARLRGESAMGPSHGGVIAIMGMDKGSNLS